MFPLGLFRRSVISLIFPVGSKGAAVVNVGFPYASDIALHRKNSTGTTLRRDNKKVILQIM